VNAVSIIFGFLFRTGFRGLNYPLEQAGGAEDCHNFHQNHFSFRNHRFEELAARTSFSGIEWHTWDSTISAGSFISIAGGFGKVSEMSSSRDADTV
jgi:hypothetical protein